MTNTPLDIETKAAQVRQLLSNAVAALDDPAVLEAVTLYALGRPEIEYEPIALAASALDAKSGTRCRSGWCLAPASTVGVCVTIPWKL